MPIDLDTMEIGVHDASLTEDCSLADSDLAMTAETCPVDERVVTHRDQRIARVCPRSDRHSDPDVIAENHLPWPADDEAPVNAEVATSLEPHTTNREPDSTPKTL